MLWLEIVGILYIYGAALTLWSGLLTRHVEKTCKTPKAAIAKGCIAGPAAWFLFVAVFAFWILWLTGNPI